MSTPTPRTNRAWNVRGDDNAEGAWSFARTLERELAIELERATHYRDEWQKERAKVKTLRAACERLRDCDLVITLSDRMDAVRDIARAAIDAAMKEGTK